MRKKAWLSKTIWFNAVSLAVAVLGSLHGSEFIAANPEVAAVIGMFITAGNVVLRFMTDRGIDVI